MYIHVHKSLPCSLLSSENFIPPLEHKNTSRHQRNRYAGYLMELSDDFPYFSIWWVFDGSPYGGYLMELSYFPYFSIWWAFDGIK